MLDANVCLIFVCSQEARQTAGPVQRHGERSPEGGTVWKENAEEKRESLKKRAYITPWTLNALCVLVCSQAY